MRIRYFLNFETWKFTRIITSELKLSELTDQSSEAFLKAKCRQMEKHLKLEGKLSNDEPVSLAEVVQVPRTLWSIPPVSDIIVNDSKSFMIYSMANFTLKEGMTLPNLGELRSESSSDLEAIHKWVEATEGIYDKEKGRFLVLPSGETIPHDIGMNWSWKHIYEEKRTLMVGIQKKEGSFNLKTYHCKKS